MYIAITVVLFPFILGFCNGQAARPFNCAIPSLCRDVVIDPRIGGSEIGVNIVVPAAPPPPPSPDCPPGTIRCNSVVCGTPSVPPSPGDGPSVVNSLPWQAYLRDDLRNVYVGGGVLIDQYNVLTAAHKISNLTAPGASMSVLIGVYNPATLPPPPTPPPAPIQQSKVIRAYINANYNVTYLKNDVAILRLATPVNFVASAMTMCLPAAGTNFVATPPRRCLVAGYGQTAFTTYDAATILRQTYVPIVSSDTCTNSYLNIIQQQTYNYLDTATGNEICAGGEANRDSCTQDGGSPLICSNAPAPSFTLAGLVLWGKGCGEAGRYGVYLNVPNYLGWISAVQQCSLQGATACANAIIQPFNV